MSQDTKECPFCAETIKVNARKCKHCGEFLPGNSRQEILRELLGDDIDIDKITHSRGVAVGKDSQAAVASEGSTLLQSKGNITFGKEKRDEQYEIALSWPHKRFWEKKPLLRGFDLSNRDLSGLELNKVDLRNSNLKGADFSGAKLREANLQKAIIVEANLRMADFQAANLQAADLRNADLYQANLCGADLSKAILERASLIQAYYSTETIWPKGFKYKQCGAIGPEADLSGADLREIDLSDTDLHKANLRKANLTEVNLNWTDLSGADLREATLRGAFLEAANLEKAKFDSPQQLLQAKSLEFATMPDGSAYEDWIERLRDEEGQRLSKQAIAAASRSKIHVNTLYTKVRKKFNVINIKDLSLEQYQDAIEYLESFGKTE